MRKRDNILVVFIFLSFFGRTYPQFRFDQLSPYEEGFHGSLHRSVRSVAECQSNEWGNNTYDKYDLEIPVPKSVKMPYSVRRFADKVQSDLQNVYSVHRRRYLMGTIAFLREPYYTLSVLEPLKPGGCQVKYYSASRGSVRQTASNRLHGCIVATNAGYFSMKNGHCLGNIVSDGRIVQVSKEMNANFGIRHDGSVVVGYIPPDEITRGSFRQLVSGIIWLVRNGSNYVNESMNVECAENQDTGKMTTFVNVLSARTAIGIDEQGRVVMAHIDGQTHARGASLYEFAELLIKHGVRSAINLDGGGSSTFVHQDVVINYPSDHCPGNPAYRCERRVSTVLCFHEVQCLEPTCSNHGNCSSGQCTCQFPWTGLDCGQLICVEDTCSGHGNCSNGSCTCEPGWGGSRCNEECSSNTYGPGCKSRCYCYGRSICDKYSGKCTCPPGYTGYSCWKECPAGFYGDKCLQRCPSHNCSGHGTCSKFDGSCICATNWTGTTCNQTISLINVNSADTNIISNANKEESLDISIRSPYISLLKSSANEIGPTPLLSEPPASHFLWSESSSTPFPDIPSKLSDEDCGTSSVTSTANSNTWLFKYVSLSALAALCISIIAHIIVCMKIKGHQNIHGNLNTLLTRRKRRRKRKRTQVPEHSSSSDCSI